MDYSFLAARLSFTFIYTCIFFSWHIFCCSCCWIGILSQLHMYAKNSDLCIRLTWNLTGSCGQQQRLRGWSRTVVEQFQDGGRPPFWKSLYIHISAKNHPIFMTFCTQQQILNWVNVTWSKMKKLHWRDSEFDRTYFWFKIFSCTVYDLIINIQENKKKIFFRTYYILRDETYKM